MLSDLTNVYNDNIAFNMENRSCLRRLTRHDDAEFSNQSIMNAMEKFVKAVNDMDETILVPCRLMDLKVGDDGDTVDVKNPARTKTSIRDMASSDLFKLYTMINSVKNELLWGQNEQEGAEEEPIATTGLTTVSSSASIASTGAPATKGHARRPSTVSMTSTNSVASISDTDSDNGNENDSGIEGEETTQAPDYPQQVAVSFRRHLSGLHRSLRQLTEAADYLTVRYQNDVGGAV